MKFLDPAEIDQFTYVLEFLQRSLTKSTDPANSSEKWVRNQAM